MVPPNAYARPPQRSEYARKFYGGKAVERGLAPLWHLIFALQFVLDVRPEQTELRRGGIASPADALWQTLVV
jgi:hypothetical protein